MKFLLLNLSFLILKAFRAMVPPRGHIPHPLSRIKLMCWWSWWAFHLWRVFSLSQKERIEWYCAILQCRHRMGIMALKDDCSWGCLCWQKLLPPWFWKGELCPLHSLCYLSFVCCRMKWEVRDTGRNTVKRIFVLFTSEKNATAKSENLNSFSWRQSIACGFQVCVFW